MPGLAWPRQASPCLAAAAVPCRALPRRAAASHATPLTAPIVRCGSAANRSAGGVNRVADRTVSVKLELDIAQYLANLRIARQATKQFADGAGTHIKELESSNKTLAKAVEQVGEAAEGSEKKTVASNKRVSSSYRDTRLWVTALTAALTNLPAIVAPALGLLMAVPGALATAGITAGTTAIALHGVGDAFKAIGKGDVEKIAQSMGKLAPSARDFVLEVQSVRGAWNELTKSTQGAFFSGFTGGLTELTHKTLPMLNVELPQVGAALGGVVNDFERWATKSETIRRIGGVISDVSETIRHAAPLVTAWSDVFLDLSHVASPLLQRILDLVTNLGERFRSFVIGAMANGQLDMLFDITAKSVEGLLNLLAKLADTLFQVLSSPGTLAAAKVLYGVLNALFTVVDGLAHAFAELPSPVQAFLLVLLAVGGTAPLVAKGIGGINNAVGNLQTVFSKIGPAAQSFGFGMQETEKSSGRARAALGGIVGLFGGPWGLAITAATVGLGILGAHLADQKAKAEQAAQAYVQFGEAVKQSRISGGETTQDLIKQNKAVQDLILDAHRYGVSSLEVVNALAGEKDAHDAVTAALAARRQELVNTINEHTYASAKSGELVDEEGRKAQAELQALDGVAGGFDRVANEQARAAAAADLYSKSVGEVSSSHATLGAQIDQLNALLIVLQSNTATAAQKADALKASMDSLFGAQISVSEATESYEAAIDNLSASVEKNGTSLKINEEAGRSNRDAVEALIQSSLALMDADIRNGVSLEEATKKHYARMDALRQESGDLHLTRQDTEDLIGTYGRVPGDVTTSIRATGVDAVLEQLRVLKIAQFALDNNISTAAATSAIAGQSSLFNQQVPFAARRAMGGPVYGLGGPTEDLVPALGPGGIRYRLSAGEHILTAAEVAAAGGHAAVMAIRKNLLHNRPPKVRYPGDGSQGIAFAGGGPVQDWPFPVSVKGTKMPYTMAELEAKFGGGPALDFLKRVAGSPYGWAQAGPNSWDCSGIISSVWNILHHRNPYQHTFSTFDEGAYFPLRGFGGELTAGWSNPGEGGPGGGPNDVGHTAGLLKGKYAFESTGSGGVRLGPGVTPINAFAHVGHYDQGGYLQPGWTMAYNGTGAPEAVISGRNGIAVDVYVRDDTGRMLQVIRKEVRTKHGGDVQKALGY
jgi:hypothetical protein